MRKLLLIAIPLFAALVVLSATDARAQDTPKGEVFAGYSYMYDDIGRDHLNLNGFETSGTLNVNKWLGVEGDFSAHFGDHDHYTFMAGPKFTYRAGRIAPYAHVLFGGDWAGNDVIDSSAFAMAVGGGVDAKINDNISIRLVQVDYHPLFYDNVAHNTRVSTGVVFTFGKR